MVERLVKTLKDGLITLSIIVEHVQDWDNHLPKKLFGQCCGIQANTKFSPHMILINHTPKLRTNNFFNLLVKAFDEDDDVSMLDEQMIEKMQLYNNDEW